MDISRSTPSVMGKCSAMSFMTLTSSPFNSATLRVKALFEVYLTTHGTLGDGTYLGTHTIPFCQFVNTLRLYQCGVHIKTDEAAHAPEHVVTLEREVDAHLCGQFHEFRLHLLPVDGFTTEGELDAGTCVLVELLDALTPGQTQDGVNVQSLIGDDTCGSLYLTRLQVCRPITMRI